MRESIFSPSPMQGNPTPTPESIGLITGATGLALLATATQAEALAAIGAEQEIEIIENANGTAIRFPGSGVQICRIQSIDLAPISGATILANTWTFPAAFSSPPAPFLNIPVTVQSGGGGPLWGNPGEGIRKIGGFGAGQPSETNVILRIFSVVGQVFAEPYVSCQAMAIGTYTP